MGRVLRFMKPYGLHLLGTVLAGLGCSLANVGVVNTLKQLVDVSLAGGLTEQRAQLMGKGFVVIGVGLVSNYLVVKLTGLIGAGVLRDMRRDLVRHVGRARPDAVEGLNFGDVMERMSSDVAKVAEYMQTYFKDCLCVPMAVLVFGGYLFSLHPLPAAACLCPLVILVPLNIRLLRPVKVAQAEYVKALGMTNNHVQEACDGVEVIKAYNLQKSRRDKYYTALKETLDISNKNDLWQYNIEPLSALIREAPTAIALCVGGALALRGEVSPGVLLAFIAGIEKINEPLVYAYQLVIRTQLALISVKRVAELLEVPVECEDEAEGELAEKASDAFELDGVTFAYGERKVLQDISLRIEKGRRVALVGPSGGGKSTLLKLLSRQYEVSEGNISLWGNRYEDISAEVLRRYVALIPQEAVMFPMSVRNNLRLGNPQASEEDIVAAAKAAGCHGFILELPAGYDTFLEEGGRNLSGGQRQRIAIARAILKDVPVFLSDEPTSALDGETQEHVCETLRRVAEGKTVVTVAHRLDTIVDYDEILVLEGGKLVERGQHEELLEKKGRYYQLYKQYKEHGGADR